MNNTDNTSRSDATILLEHAEYFVDQTDTHKGEREREKEREREREKDCDRILTKSDDKRIAILSR